MNLLPGAPSSNVKEALRKKAFELGAVAFGVSSAAVDELTRERMRAAIGRGDLATWRYDDAYAQAVCDPGSLLPGARAVVCIAVPYAGAPVKTRRGQGRISNYAAHTDYHRVMQRILDALLHELRMQLPDAAAIAVCDTKPLAERAFAARAGLGWIGKHTNLIIPAGGSFVFLGEIVCDVPFETDAAKKTHCGSCMRCIAQCPTGALRGDYSLDATRCISDLTQRREAIPRNMRGLMGEWIWGCDVCQEACPPVQRAPREPHPAFSLPAFDPPDLIELLHMQPAEWRRRFGDTAMAWRGATVLRRNAAIALGNSLDRGYVADLALALGRDPAATVRGHVAWALGRIGGRAALRILHEALPRETSLDVREEISAAIDDIPA